MRKRLGSFGLVLAGLLMGGNAGGQTVSGSLRLRGESWRWFEYPGVDGAYSYGAALARIGVSDQKPRLSWRVEVAVPVLVGLPVDAVAPAPGGQLGAGASYWQANDSSQNVAGFFLKQAFLRIGRPPAVGGHSLRAGRFEFIDGTELVPADTTLAALKRDRIAHRLIGNFGWTHVQRSFDGAHYSFDQKGRNWTAVALRPTRGVFDANGWGDLDVALFYASLNRSGPHHDWRIFASAYDDYRSDPTPLKADNRPLPARAADSRDVIVNTIGAHYLRTWASSIGTIDLLGWGNVQAGNWGELDHRAYGFSAEAGVQPKGLASLRPWLRASYTRTSGDDDPADDRHETFFQMLPTPRVYARFPFYNMMNLGDAAVMLMLRPDARVTVRAEAHKLRLSEAADSWYAGGGAFERETFGFAGRPANGESDVANVFDLGAELRVHARVSVNLYGALARGGDVVQRIYGNSNASFGYVELELRK